MENFTKYLKAVLCLILATGISWPFIATAEEKLNANSIPIEVSGIVNDVDGNPLIGVNVLVKDKDVGTATDFDGRFALSNLEAEDVLIVSYIGYLTQEYPLNGQTQVEIVLLSDAEMLEEVVVVGYGEQKKVNLTGAVGTVGTEDILKVPSTNVSSTLRGEVPGLLIQQSGGAPGMDNATLSIRGFGNPLVLVDGIEMEWERIDPNDIESISVLKDAAGAIYGSKAGNGVVLITTKRGKSEGSTIKYNGSVSFQNPTVLPSFVDSWQYAQLLREGELFQDLNPTYSEEEIQKFKTGGDPRYPNTDWYGAMFSEWVPMSTHSLSAQGVKDNVNYYISAGYMDQNSLFESGDLNFSRYNARSNIDAKISENLTASLSLAYVNEFRDQPQASLSEIWHDLFWSRPDYPHEIPDPELGASYAGFNVRNPYRQTFKDYTGFINERQENINGYISLNYKLSMIEGMSFTALLNYQSRNIYNKTQDRPFELFSYDYDSQSYTSYGFNGNSVLDEWHSNYRQIFPRLLLNYSKSYKNFSFKGLVGSEWMTSDYNYLSAGKVDLLSLDIPYLFSGAIDNTSAGGFRSETAQSSYFGRINVDYNGKYLFETSFRFDGSYKFPSNSRWGFFPSFSMGWRLSEEDFLKDLNWLDNLKLRTSFSKSGDDNVGDFKFLSGYSIRNDLAESQLHTLYVFGNDVFRIIEPNSLANENITWLDMTIYNVGLDGNFFDNKLGFEIDMFYRIVDNIFGAPVDRYPSTFGAQLPLLNINSTSNNGVDMKLTHYNRVNKDFSYSIYGSFLFTREKYRRWAEQPYDDPDEIRIYKREGHFVNRVVGYASDGIFMTQEEIDNYQVIQDEAENSTLLPGDIRYKDLNNDGVINWRDQKEIGFSNFPNISYGLGVKVQYKKFDFSTVFEGASMFNHEITYFPFNNFSQPMDFHWNYSWRSDPNNPGQNINPNAQLPAILGDGTGRNFNNEKVSDFWLKDGTYVRVKKINLSYSLMGDSLDRIGFKNLTISLSGSNLLTFSKLGIYKNSIDPEAINENLWTYPPVKTIAIGLNLTF